MSDKIKLKDLKVKVLEGEENTKVKRERINRGEMNETKYRKVQLVIDNEDETPILFMDNKNNPKENIYIKVDESRVTI